jgi:hypothetical protein
MDTKNCIQTAAEFKAETAFTPEYCKPENLQERIVEGLGIAISQWAEWDGIKILEVFHAALEDANFHQEASIIEGLINIELRG